MHPSRPCGCGRSTSTPDSVAVPGIAGKRLKTVPLQLPGLPVTMQYPPPNSLPEAPPAACRLTTFPILLASDRARFIANDKSFALSREPVSLQHSLKAGHSNGHADTDNHDNEQHLYHSEAVETPHTTPINRYPTKIRPPKIL